MPPALESHETRWRVTKPLSNRIRASRVPTAGLPTDGYQCYQNAVIQAFCHVPKFVDWLEHARSGRNTWARHLRALTRAFWNTRLDRQRRKEQIALQLDRWRVFLKKEVVHTEPSLRFLFTDKQQDVTDYLRVFNSCFGSSPMISPEDAMQLRGLFQIDRRRVTICHKCGRENTDSGESSFWALSVPVARPGFGPLIKSLTECFDRDDGDFRCECRNTGRYDARGSPVLGTTRQSERNRITNAPRVLILELVILNYGTNWRGEINPRALRYPEMLDLTEFVDEQCRNECGTLRYRLNSVICHKGYVDENNETFGHYKIRTRGPGGFFEANDIDITELSSVKDLLTMDGEFKPRTLFYLAEEDGTHPNPVGTIAPARARCLEDDHPSSLVIAAWTRSGRTR